MDPILDPDPTKEVPIHGTVGWVGLVLHQLSEAERRILARIEESNASIARERERLWEIHAKEHLILHGRLLKLEEHVDEERREELVMEARLSPLRSGGQWIVREWRTVTIIALVIADIVNHFMGPVIKP